MGTSNPYSQNDSLGPFIHLSNERQCEGKFLVEERTQTQETALELPNKPPLGIPVVYLKHLNSYKAIKHNKVKQKKKNLHPISITQMENIFSVLVFGDTLPNPTLVKLLSVKYSAVTYLDLRSGPLVGSDLLKGW